MITRDNPSVYGKLFEKANEVLANSIVVLNSNGKTVSEAAAEKGFDKDTNPITSIDGYFTYIDILGEYEYILINAMPDKDKEDIDQVLKNELDNGFDPIFMCLPLDEPTFYINANTRKIEISKDFTGQQVQGDEAAEIIWFAVDRYFDTTDLYNTNIYIQWEVDSNGHKAQGLTPAFGRSLTIRPGQIVFGWPLGVEITEAGSNVKFAVRFYIFDDKGEKLVYNLTTLPSNIKINPSINIDIADDQLVSAIEFNKNHMIYNRLRASATPSLIPPAEPVIELNVYAVVNDVIVQKKTDLDENGKAILKAKACVEDGLLGAGKIDYIWFYYDKDGVRHEIDNANVKAVYEQSKDSSVSSNDKYYVLNGSGYDLVIPQAGANQNPSALGWYEQQSQCTATVAGKYGISAFNKFNGSVESVVSTTENLFEIPFATEPLFEAENNILNIVLDGDGKANLKMNVSTEDNGEINNYQWFWSSEIAEDKVNFVIIENAVTNELTVSGGENGFGELANGLYKLQATNNKNNDSNTKLSDIAIRVSEQIKTPILKPYSVFKDNSTSAKEVALEPKMIIEADAHATIKINLDEENINSDRYEYLWQNSTNEGATWVDLIGGDNMREIRTEEEGIFRCIITNHYNGKTATVTTGSFAVI